jgi:hypothetical protein
MAYIPIDNENEFSLGSNPAVSSAIIKRLSDNAADMQTNRFLRHGASYHIGGVQGVLADIVGDDFVGYPDDFKIGGNPETIGLQFSTHVAHPMCLPFTWMPSALADKITVRIACKIENAPMDLFALAYDPRGPSYSPLWPDYDPNATTYSVRNLDTPNSGTSVFNTIAKIQQTYLELPVFSSGVSETDDMQFFEVEIPLNNLSGRGTYSDSLSVTTLDNNGNGDFRSNIQRQNFIVLCFASRMDETSGQTVQVEGIRYGRKAIRIDETVTPFLPNGPGKFHAMVKIENGVFANGEYKDTWHHVIQARPFDVNNNAFGNNDVEFYIWPAIPESFNLPFTPGLTNEQLITYYPLSKCTLYSVTIEESL